MGRYGADPQIYGADLEVAAPQRHQQLDEGGAVVADVNGVNALRALQLGGGRGVNGTPPQNQRPPFKCRTPPQ